uniref:BED-type domain-containing protein n=1 Tax=Anopheles dirus TaxID=7168 RepID=A0A182N4Y4_9DIPT
MGVAKCRNCRMVYKYDTGTTANLKRHIGRCHRRYPYETQRSATSSPVSEFGIEAEPASSEPESEPEAKPETKHSPIAFTIEAEPASESEAEDAKPTRSRQRTASAETEPEHFLRQPLTSETSDLLDQTLLDVLCKDSVPFDLLESENFKKFVHTLNPMYNLPAKKQMSNSMLGVIYAEAVENVEDRLSSATSIALTCEGWASVGNTHYVAVTGHFLDKHFKISSNLLECSEVSNPRSAKHITTRVKASIERYKLQGKVVAIVTDSAADGKVAVSDLKMTHVTCFAHTLNLIVESAISDSIKSTIDEVRRIVRHFKSIPNGAETLRTTQHRLFQAEVKLKLDTPARCNATYDMLNRFLQNKVSLLVCLDTLGITTSLGNVDWDIIEQALSALKYFNSAANVISAERHVMISHVGFLSSVLLQKTANLANNPLILDEVQFFVSLLTQGLQERLEDFFCSELVAKAMLLDPRIKKLGFQNGLLSYKETHDAIVMDLIPLQTPSVDELQSVTTGVANEDVDMLFGDVLGANVTRPTETPRQMALDELERYMNMNNIELDKDPLTWWKVHHAKFPSLFALANAILCIPGTVAPGERLFSKAGQSYCEKRARLSPKHLKEILFVQQNVTR